MAAIDGPLWAHYIEKLHAIEESEPTSFPAIIAKAKAAKLEASPFDDSLALRVIHDLVDVFGDLA